MFSRQRLKWWRKSKCAQRCKDTSRSPAWILGSLKTVRNHMRMLNLECQFSNCWELCYFKNSGGGEQPQLIGILAPVTPYICQSIMTFRTCDKMPLNYKHLLRTFDELIVKAATSRYYITTHREFNSLRITLVIWWIYPCLVIDSSFDVSWNTTRQLQRQLLWAESESVELTEDWTSPQFASE